MRDAHVIEVTRLYADDDGESRFEKAIMPMSLQAFAPPAAPFHVTEAQPAQHFVVIELPVGWGGMKPHPAPGRHMYFCLSGRVRVTVSSGETRTFGAGDGVLLEDTTGKGHRTEVVSDEPVRAVMIRLP